LAVGAVAVYACWHWIGSTATGLISVLALLVILIREASATLVRHSRPPLSSATLDVLLVPKPMKRRFADTRPFSPSDAPSRSAVVQSEWHLDPELCALVDDPPLHPEGIDGGSSANEDERRTARAPRPPNTQPDGPEMYSHQFVLTIYPDQPARHN
jgi:hypothetical protein